MTTPDWSFLRQPVWLVGHVVAVVAVVVFMSAGFWQLERHETRRALDAELEQRRDAPAAQLDDLAGADPVDVRFREVTATGTFDVDEEVMLVLQPLRGVSGHHVLTPLVMDDGKAVLVDRGWVPLELDQPSDPEFRPPTGVVTVTGFVRTTQTRGRSVPDEGELLQIGRVDIERLQRQIDETLSPFYIQLSEPLAGTEDLPVVAPLGALENAPPHLSYAVQWFIFSAVVVIGYGILLRRTSRSGPTAVSAAG
jgi:surfeit locus 1 family protein